MGVSRTVNQPFSRRAVLTLLAAGVAGAIAFLLLSAYAPDLRPGTDGGAHAMSTAATGFKALHDLNDAVSGDSTLLRSKDIGDARGILILTPTSGTSSQAVAERIDWWRESGQTRPVLIILPKWMTAPDPAHRGWVMSAGQLPEEFVKGRLDRVAGGSLRIRTMKRTTPAVALWPGHGDVRFRLPREGQSIEGERLETVIADPAGGALLAKVKDRPIYILADPDILDNKGLKDLATARAAIAMLDALSPDTAGLLTFDMVLNGFARSPNLLKLAFEPPFLAATLCLLAAALLAGLQAAVRFGPPIRHGRAFAFGKTALLDSSAALLRRAGHEHRGGDRYLALTREAVAGAIGVPVDAESDRVDAYLERLPGRGGHQWAELVDQARRAANNQELVAAARALHRWRRDVTRDRG